MATRRRQLGTTLLIAIVAVAVVVVAGMLLISTAEHTTGPDPRVALTAEQIPTDRVVTDATGNYSATEAAVIRKAFEDGHSETAGQRLDIDGAYVTHNDSFYRVDVAEAGRVTRSRYVVTFEPVSNASGTVRDVDTLPSVDRHRAVSAYRRSLSNETDQNLTAIYANPHDADESVLVNGSVTHVTVQETTFRSRVSRREVRLDSYRYTTTRVAHNESAFRNLVIRDAGSAVSAADAEPLQSAIDDGRFTPDRGDEGERLSAVEPIATLCETEYPEIRRSDSGVQCYVRYDGGLYRLTFESVQ